MLTETTQCDSCKKIMFQNINKPNLQDIDKEPEDNPYPTTVQAGYLQVHMLWQATTNAGLSNTLCYCNHECMLNHLNGEFLTDMLHAREVIVEKENELGLGE